MNAHMVLAAAAAALLAGTSAGAFQNDGVDIDLDEILPISAAAQTERDRTLTGLNFDLSEHGLSVDALRSVGSDGIADYWVGVVDDTQVCIVGYIPGNDWVAASTCSTVSEFYRQGLGLGLGKGGDDGTEAYLLPADIDPSQLRLPSAASPFGTAQAQGAVLFALDPTGPKPAPTEVKRENGVSFHFAPLANPEQ